MSPSRRRARGVLGSRRLAAPAVILAAAGCLIACASPLQRADALAERSGFSKEIVTGTTYRHVVYRHAVHRSGATLHVYIEGDGTPFRGRTVIADDPTPHDPLMLRLMAEDAAPSVYIGRPCYFGLHLDPGCGTEAWTSRRFAPEILESMSSVVESERVRAGASRLALFGHSGGGALAVLLAVRQPSVVRVVTIGATLDIGAWCRLHGYTPLAGSLNPVLAPMQRKGVEVLHWVGENDTNTPPSLIGMAARTRGEPVRVVAGFDHHCCWRRMWHDILATAGNPASD